MDSLPPPEDNSLHGICFERVPRPSQGNTHEFPRIWESITTFFIVVLSCFTSMRPKCG